MAETWWKEAVVYQVYPSSFIDSNGDGWGDVRGITSKLDYLKTLGVDIIWVSPIFKSPQKDMGYDISDYKAIDPKYGTIDDVDELIVELTKRGMKLLMDLVVNHTSDQHSWFIESRSSLTNPKRSWYIWKKPRRDDKGSPLPPNNWFQILGEANSAWTYDAETDEYYLSIFSNEQPDLNWENPEVRAAIHDVMNFWLQRGACGYRMDVINYISKDQRFPDAEAVLGPEHPYQPGHQYFRNGPRMHEYLQEIKREVISKYDAMTVGEMPGIEDVDEIIRTVNTETGDLNMIFIFDIVNIDIDPHAPRFKHRKWTARDLARIVTKWQQVMNSRNGWNSVFCENHDHPRSVSRYTDDSDTNRFLGAKLLALMLTTLSGTLFVYQGQELGMRNVPNDWDVRTEYRDIESINIWKKVQNLCGNEAESLAYWQTHILPKVRDHSRTPVQWDNSPNAGFCAPGVIPWMRVNDDYPNVNAKQQIHHEGNDYSVWQFWQEALKTRKKYSDVFIYGEYEPLQAENESIFAYVRTGKKGGKWLVALNFSGVAVQLELPASLCVEAVVTGNYSKTDVKKALYEKNVPSLNLRPWEGLLAKCEN